jgi:hypothetical protein
VYWVILGDARQPISANSEVNSFQLLADYRIFAAMEIILVVLVGAVVAFLIYLGHLASKKRREALRALASELNLSFDPSRDHAHDSNYREFDIFRRGRRRTAYTTISGRIEIGERHCWIKMGDYCYTIKTGKSSTTYRFSYLILKLPYESVPQLSIRRENMLDRIAGAVGFDDIDFESAEFSRKFYVKSSDKKFAYDVIHPRTMEFLLSSGCPVLQLENGKCCIYDGTSTKWDVSDFRKRLWWMSEFLKLWPDYLTEQLD